MEYNIQMLDWFYDGNVYPKRLKPGQLLTVDKATYHKMLQSTPDCVEVISKTVPPSSVKKTQPKTRKEKNVKED